jgi:nucleotide-binding universal stress UspA family protein
MYEDIIVPVDGSAGVKRVVAHATSLAALHGSVLDFVYVIDTAAFTSMPIETSWEGLGTSLRKEGEIALNEAIQMAGDTPHTSHLLEGGPSHEITAYAKRSGADLIVMGTHGRGGINRILLGSVAERVVRSSPIPVLTVRVGETTESTSAVTQPEK